MKDKHIRLECCGDSFQEGRDGFDQTSWTPVDDPYEKLKVLIICILQLEFLKKLVVVKGIVCIITLASLTIKCNCAELQFRQAKIK